MYLSLKTFFYNPVAKSLNSMPDTRHTPFLMLVTNKNGLIYSSSSTYFRISVIQNTCTDKINNIYCFCFFWTLETDFFLSIWCDLNKIVSMKFKLVILLLYYCSNYPYAASFCYSGEFNWFPKIIFSLSTSSQVTMINCYCGTLEFSLKSIIYY